MPTLEVTPEKHGVKDKYSSVGIFFEKEPTEGLINKMKGRAHRFAEQGRIFDRPVNLRILGFRLRKYETKETEIEL